VPPPEKPELPIPSPAASQRLPIMLAPAPATPQPEAGMNIPEVSRLDGAPPDPAGVDDGFAAKPESAVTLAVAEMMEARASEIEAKAPEPAASSNEAKLWALSDAKLALLPSDALAAILLLSEDERIALCT
jgi:hypothetical protein